MKRKANYARHAVPW